MRGVLKESSCLGLQLKAGGKRHLRLNSGRRPIANKYREGKMKSTLKRELKAREIVKRETIEASIVQCGRHDEWREASASRRA